MLGSDGISDPMPGLGIPNWPFPVHQIGITGMGLHLIDNMAQMEKMKKMDGMKGHDMSQSCCCHPRTDLRSPRPPVRPGRAH